MILFSLICAGLVAIALAFILPTLLQRGGPDTAEAERKEANVDIYRDQLAELEADLRNGIIGPEQYQKDRDEIERRLLDDVSATADSTKAKSKQTVSSRRPVYGLALGIPVLAVVLYLLLGNSAALSGEVQPATMPRSQTDGQMTPQQIEANVAKLAKRLEQNPDDPQGWVMLARSYLSLQKYTEAGKAYAKATSMNSRDADLLIEYAFVMAMGSGRQLEGQPRELIKQALEIDPENAKALELAGSAEFQAKNYQAAIGYWQKLLQKGPADSELTRSLTERINEAKTLAGASAK
ncbi:MAG TPA: c-type cytochrome biogenesis protein CcmI [Pyrinomonadaceae bacterium]|jgi:cytochrome c-type biogenesis protein CcmH|nr:c-type cytochrome biogenesis protein CcmI [Pyrinomonadaceae bacterium]